MVTWVTVSILYLDAGVYFHRSISVLLCIIPLSPSTITWIGIILSVIVFIAITILGAVFILGIIIILRFFIIVLIIRIFSIIIILIIVGYVHAQLIALIMTIGSIVWIVLGSLVIIITTLRCARRIVPSSDCSPFLVL